MPHTFLEHSHYPRQRQDHLDVGIGFGGEPAELLHGALLVNLISFLHSDSPFSWKKNFPEAITPRGVRVATFYGLPGNFDRPFEKENVKGRAIKTTQTVYARLQTQGRDRSHQGRTHRNRDRVDVF